MSIIPARLCDLYDKTRKAFAEGRVIYLLSTNHVKLLRKLIDAYERYLNPLPSIKNCNVEMELAPGWSFVIVTDGKSYDNLSKSIISIIREFKDDNNFEIIVIGQNENYPVNADSIRYIYYHGIGFMPGYITYKKNIGAKLARFDKLVIMHDYLALCEGWKDGYTRYGSDFDVCTNKLIDYKGRRSVDWTVKAYPNVGLALLPYSEYSEYIYLSGAYFVAKTKFYLNNMLDETKRWNEKEDFEWSDRIIRKTKIMLNQESTARYVKEKPLDFAPYNEDWIKSTMKLYSIYNRIISKDSFEIDVLN